MEQKKHTTTQIPNRYSHHNVCRTILEPKSYNNCRCQLVKPLSYLILEYKKGQTATGVAVTIRNTITLLNCTTMRLQALEKDWYIP